MRGSLVARARTPVERRAPGGGAARAGRPDRGADRGRPGAAPAARGRARVHPEVRGPGAARPRVALLVLPARAAAARGADSRARGGGGGRGQRDAAAEAATAHLPCFYSCSKFVGRGLGGCESRRTWRPRRRVGCIPAAGARRPGCAAGARRETHARFVCVWGGGICGYVHVCLSAASLHRNVPVCIPVCGTPCRGVRACRPPPRDVVCAAVLTVQEEQRRARERARSTGSPGDSAAAGEDWA